MNAMLDKRSLTNMTSKGQVLIPKDVRDAIGLLPGRPVAVGINDRGEAVVRPAGPPAGETPDERVARIMAALERARLRHGTGRTTEEIMFDLRGDEPLP